MIDVTYLDATNQKIATEVMATEIIPDTTAQRIGLAPGDRLLHYDGIRLASKEQMIALVSAGVPGPHVLVVRRGSDVAAIEVPAGRLGVYLETVRATSDASVGNQ